MKLTKNNIVTVSVIAVVLLLLLLLFKDVWRGYVIETLGGYTDKGTIHRVDTLPAKYETIRPPAEIKTVKVPIDKPIIKYKDTIVFRDIPYPVIIDSSYTYTNYIEDSILKGSIVTKINKTNSEILEQKLDYVPKIPLTIIKTLPIKETIETTLIKNDRPKIGLGVLATNIESIGLIGAYQTKNNLQFQLNYSILVGDKKIVVDNNTYNHLIQIGIIKFF